MTVGKRIQTRQHLVVRTKLTPQQRSKLRRVNDALRLVLIGGALCLLTGSAASFLKVVQQVSIDREVGKLLERTSLRNEWGHRPDAWRWYNHEFIGFDPSFEDNDDYLLGQ